MLLKNDRLLKALWRKEVDTTPVWIMRQAGRYLPEYRQVRKDLKDFLSLCKNPALACEVTLQPLARFDLDAAILFSDILTIPDALGLGLYFEEGEGPRFKKPLREEKDILQLPELSVEKDLSYVLETIDRIKQGLNNRVPLLGFSGSPWTLAAYMIEGSGSKTFIKARSLLYATPQLAHVLLEKLTQCVTDYLKAQITAGVDAVMIFDTWGGLLTPEGYEEFSLQYMRQIIASVKAFSPKTPIIFFTKGGGHWLEAMADSGCHALGLDWSIGLGDAKKRVGHKVALQGNLDPAVLWGTPDKIRYHVEKLLSDFGGDVGHVFNLGHGIEPSTPVESVELLVNLVHELGNK